MKVDEIVFFVYCYFLRTFYGFSVEEVVEICSLQIPKKRLLYLLKKWEKKGFYNYGVSIDMGWFEPEYMPERYRKIIDIKRPFNEFYYNR